MVGHQHVGVQGAIEVAQRRAEPMPVGEIVLFAEEAWFAVVAALDDVQRNTFEVNAWATRHGPMLEKSEPGPFMIEDDTIKFIDHRGFSNGWAVMKYGVTAPLSTNQTARTRGRSPVGVCNGPSIT